MEAGRAAEGDRLRAAERAAEAGDDHECLRLGEAALREAELAGDEPGIADAAARHAGWLLEFQRLGSAADLSAAAANRAERSLGEGRERWRCRAVELRSRCVLERLGVRELDKPVEQLEACERELGPAEPETLWLQLARATRELDGAGAGAAHELAGRTLERARDERGDATETARLHIEWALALSRRVPDPDREALDRAAEAAKRGRRSLPRSLPGEHHLELLAGGIESGCKSWRKRRDELDPDDRLAAIRAHLGPHHPSTLKLLGFDHRRLRAIGRAAEAASAASELLDGYEKLAGPLDPLTLATLEALVTSARVAGAQADAADAARRLLERREQAHGADNRLSVRAARLLSEELARERPQDAHDLLEAVYEQISANPAADEERALLLAQRADLWAARDDDEWIARAAADAAEPCRERLGAEHPATLRVLGFQARAALALGDKERALELATPLAKTLDRVAGPKDERTLDAVLMRVKALSLLNRDSEAVRSAVNHWRRARGALGERHPVTIGLGAMWQLTANYTAGSEVPLEEAREIWDAATGAELDHLSRYGVLLAGNATWLDRSQRWPVRFGAHPMPGRDERDFLVAAENRLSELTPGSALDRTTRYWRISNARCLLRVGASSGAASAVAELLRSWTLWRDEDDEVLRCGLHLARLLDEAGRAGEGVAIAETARGVAARVEDQGEPDRLTVHELGLARLLRNSGTAELLERAAELFAELRPRLAAQREGVGPERRKAIDGHALSAGIGLGTVNLLRGERRVGTAAEPIADSAAAYDRALDSRGAWLEAVGRDEWMLLGEGESRRQLATVLSPAWAEALEADDPYGALRETAASALGASLSPG